MKLRQAYQRDNNILCFSLFNPFNCEMCSGGPFYHQDLSRGHFVYTIKINTVDSRPRNKLTYIQLIFKKGKSNSVVKRQTFHPMRGRGIPVSTSHSMGLDKCYYAFYGFRGFKLLSSHLYVWWALYLTCHLCTLLDLNSKHTHFGKKT